LGWEVLKDYIQYPLGQSQVTRPAQFQGLRRVLHHLMARVAETLWPQGGVTHGGLCHMRWIYQASLLLKTKYALCLKMGMRGLCNRCKNFWEDILLARRHVVTQVVCLPSLQILSIGGKPTPNPDLRSPLCISPMNSSVAVCRE
jgi:hypothetical protein